MQDLVSIIIPLFNESENVDFLADELFKTFGTNQLFEVEFILVDDGSVDNTFNKVLATDFHGLQVRAVKLSRNFGAHEAIRAGILKSNGNIVTFLPADLQDPPDVSIRLYEKFITGYDIVWGQRRTYQKKYSEKLFSEFYAYLMQRIVFANFPEKGMDLAMFNEKVKEQLCLNAEANSSIILQIMGLGYKQGFIEYDKVDRKRGTSKWTFAKKIKLVVDSFIAFSYFPIRLVSFVGVICFIFGIVWTIYIMSRKLMFNDVVQGWALLSSILLFGFGITNISLGIVAEYLWRTLDAARNRPVFIVDKIVDINYDKSDGQGK